MGAFQDLFPLAMEQFQITTSIMLINDTEYLLFIVDEDCGKFEDGNSEKIYWELRFQEFNLYEFI